MNGGRIAGVGSRAEPLERRTLLAGVTVVTHGFSTGAGADVAWIDTMARAIAARAGGANVYRLTTNAAGGLQSFAPVLATGGSSGESVVEVDWTAAANYISTGVSASVISATVASALTSYPTAAHPFAELPIHLIGHSRGGSVVADLAKDLGAAGLDVDQLTTLDPHPITAADYHFFDNTTDPAVNAYDNVVYADNLWETDQSYPHGAPVAGADNVDLTAYTVDHSGVHADYYGTINRTAADDGDGTPVPANAYPGDTRSTTGYDDSLVGRGDRPADGTSALAGGSAARVHVAPAAAAPWANLTSLSVATGTVANGATVSLAYRYQSAAAGSTVAVYVDDDANPYDGTGTLVAGSPSLAATGATPAVSSATASFPWTAGRFTAGLHYLLAAITNAAGRVRYLPLADPLDVTADGVAVVTKQWTGEATTAWSDARNWASGGVPTAADRAYVNGTVSATSGITAASLDLAGGTLTVAGRGAVSGAVTVGPAATVRLTGPAGSAGVFSADALSLAGTLDVGPADVVVATGDVAALSAAVPAGRLTSATAAADSAHLTAVAVAAGRAVATTFDGLPVSASTVLVRATLYGDTNLDRMVTAADYTRLDAGAVNGLTGWVNGDFNYDGVVDGTDYALADNAFNRQPAAAPAAVVATARPIASSTATGLPDDEARHHKRRR